MAKKIPTVLFRIQLTPPAKAKLNGLRDQLGITQISITGKLMEYFAKQPAEVQCAILGLYPKSIEPQVAQMILDLRK